MWRLDVPQVLISVSAIFGISLILYDFNVKAFHAIRDLAFAMVYHKDNAEDEEEEPDEDENDKD